MHTTSHILAALKREIELSRLVAAVAIYPVAEISRALESLRDAPDTLAVIVPARTTWKHVMAHEDLQIPGRAEASQEVEIMITAVDLRHGDAGNASAQDLADALSHHLLWNTLQEPFLLTLPNECEPMIIENDGGGRGREVWKLTLEIRQQFTH